MTRTGSDGAAVFEVADLVSRIECAYAKPLLWVSELHPAFASTRAPDLRVTVRYDDGYWARDLPWIAPDQLVDVPVYAAGASGAGVIRSAYYDAELDGERARVVLRLAGGFNVGGALRALYAAMLPERGACLVRATIRPVATGAILTCGEADDDVVALIERDGYVEVEPTPFHGGTTPAREPRRRVEAIDVGGGRATGPVGAAASVLERVVVVDHAPRTFEAVLDMIARLAARVPVVAGAVEERGANVVC